MKNHIVYSETMIQQRVKELAQQITHDYQGKELVLVGILNGSMYFIADLSRAINLPMEIDFIAMGVYASPTQEIGIVQITKDLNVDIQDKHVIIIEDIIRTGLTIGYLVQNLESRNPASVRVCTLLVNPDQQLINVPIQYSGYDIEDEWLMGYGMDVQGKGRNLPYIQQAEKKRN